MEFFENKMAFCGLRNRFMTFYCFKCLENGEFISDVNFEFFSIIFPIDGDILKICFPKFLNEEFEHIKNFFSKLKYPEFFIHRIKSEPINIHSYTVPQ